MLLKFVKDDDFVNYRKCSLFLGTPTCSWKCCHEARIPESVCQNNPWFKQKNIEITNEEIVKRYLSDPLEEAIVFGGLEPLDSFSEVLSFIDCFRQQCVDDVVIYTGYYPDEIGESLASLGKYPNIIVKFGRYVPNSPSIADPVLGVTLASSNQFAKKIS